MYHVNFSHSDVKQEYYIPRSKQFLNSLISCCEPDTRNTPWWCMPETQDLNVKHRDKNAKMKNEVGSVTCAEYLNDDHLT